MFGYMGTVAHRVYGWETELKEADEMLGTAEAVGAEAEKWAKKAPSIAIRSFAWASCLAHTAKVLYETIQRHTGMNLEDRIVEAYGCRKEQLIAILQDVQDEFGYLPEEALRRVSERLGVPLIQVYGVATFFKAFRLKPRGRHLVTVCMGTACYVRGAPAVLEELKRLLGVQPGETTEDMEFTLETVNCLGACALGPVVVVDDEYHEKVTPGKVKKILEKYSSVDARRTRENGQAEVAR